MTEDGNREYTKGFLSASNAAGMVWQTLAVENIHKNESIRIDQLQIIFYLFKL